MDKEVIAVFSKIIDNSDDIITEIRTEVYKTLGINSQAEQLVEFVKESLETFSFNVVEKYFFEQIRSVVMEEMNKNDTVNFDTFSNRLIEKLRAIKTGEISFDDDFKNLSVQIVNKFPYINLSMEQLHTHFSSKKDKIVNTINLHNQNVIETLVKLTPRLANELEKQVETKDNINTAQPQNKEVTTNDVLTVEQFLSRCTKRLNEVNLMFQNGGNSNSEIAKGFRQLKRFIENLNDETFFQGILERYAKLNNSAQGFIYDKIIFENVPMLKDIYEKYDNLLVTPQVEQLKSNLDSVFEAKPTQGPGFIDSNGTIPMESANGSLQDQNNFVNGIHQTGVEEVEMLYEQEKPNTIEQSRQSQTELQLSSFEEKRKEKLIKANLVQQIINYMNKFGELYFGEISFSDRMIRIQEIRNRLENKSIEDLQILLATYQKQNLNNEVQLSSSIGR